MMGYTHLIIGAGAGLGAALAAGAAPVEAVALAAASGVFALLPDIDHPRGMVRQKLGVVGDVGLFWLSHRGLTHTLLAWGLLAAALFYFLPLPYASALAAAYGSHLAADMVTRAGLPLLWPLSGRSFYLLPGLLRIPTGGIVEKLIGVVAVGFLAVAVYGLGLF